MLNSGWSWHFFYFVALVAQSEIILNRVKLLLTKLSVSTTVLREAGVAGLRHGERENVSDESPAHVMWIVSYAAEGCVYVTVQDNKQLW